MKKIAAILCILLLGGAYHNLPAQVAPDSCSYAALDVDKALLSDLPLLRLALPREVATTLPVIRPVHLASPEAFNRMIDLIDETFHVYPEPQPEPLPRLLADRKTI